MKTVLFVDDDRFILDGLRSLLRKKREHWDMAFANSGPAALEVLRERPRDVVVSDMRMPGMDGAELLREVRDRYPGTARLILTGEASQEDLIRALPVAQQVLSKPCERAALCETIERLFRVQALLTDERIHIVVGRLDRLPLLPKGYDDLTQAMLRPKASVAEIVEIVEKDPVLSAAVLSLANAGFYGRAQPRMEIQAAVSLIGFQLLRTLALSTHIFSRVDTSLMGHEALTHLPQTSFLKARLARQFVSDPALGEEAFAAALLLDIGQIVLAHDSAISYLKLLERASTSGCSILELEREQLGFTHAQVGAYMLGLWGLPARVVELVACHHLPELVELSENPVAPAVHVADVLVDAWRKGEQDPLPAIAHSVRSRPEFEIRLRNWQSIVNKEATATQ